MARVTKPKIALHGRYFTRDLGWKVNAAGKRVQHRFVLGDERRAAERASLLLEQLWEIVVEQKAEENRSLGLTEDQEEPTWGRETMDIADAVRKGETRVVVPFNDFEAMAASEGGPHGPAAYAAHLHHLGQTYRMIQFVPEVPAEMQKGQEQHRRVAVDRARQATLNAAIAKVPLPSMLGSTLYGALDAYAASVLETKKRGGEVTAWAKVLNKSVLNLKAGSPDMPLSVFDYNAIERVKHYWTGRPAHKLTGRPISVETVRGQLKALRMFCKWCDRNSALEWHLPRAAEQAWSADLERLRTDNEVSKLRRGVETFTVAELTIIYRYATDFERALLAVSLNCGFAHAELCGLRRDEIDLAGTPPTIKRVRRKSRVWAEFALWPESVKALQWVEGRGGSVESPLAILSERGQPLDRQRIANAWGRLHKRIRQDLPEFRFLAFKFIRKTAGQMIRHASDGETAGVFLAHGTPVKSDDLLDSYTRRDFTRVAAALAKVHEQLAPMFAVAGDSFTQPRKKGGPNISLATIEKIKRLHADGVSPAEIMKAVGVSRPTVYRHIAPAA